MTKRKNRNYTDDFKQEAVALVTEKATACQGQEHL